MIITRQENLFYPNTKENTKFKKKSSIQLNLNNLTDKKEDSNNRKFSTGKSQTPVNNPSLKGKLFSNNQNDCYFEDNANINNMNSNIKNNMNNYNNYNTYTHFNTAFQSRFNSKQPSNIQLDNAEVSNNNTQKINIIDNYAYQKSSTMPPHKGSTQFGASEKKFSEEMKMYSSARYMDFPDKSPIRATKTKINFKNSNNTPFETPNNNNINTTLLNLVNEIKDPNRSTLMGFNNMDQQGTSIYLPINTMDLDEELKLAEEGYMEEDDEDFKSSGMSGGFFGLDDDENYNFKMGDDDKDKSENNINNMNKSIEALNQTYLDSLKPVLSTKEELEAVLFPKSQFDVTMNKTFNIKRVTNEFGVEIIEENLLVVMLNYIYSELHNGLIELGDAFLEERRKYFQKNMDTYISIIEFFLKSKEQFFLGVLSQVMSKLLITQTLLDCSLEYYMNQAQETPKVVEVKLAYEKIYRSGEKYSIAPKIITKLRLKDILRFQIESFQELSEKYPNLNNEILEVMVTDTVYSKFGFDKEAIRGAIQKHEIDTDQSFEEIISQLDQYRNSSFLNI